jgi:predicted metal-binding membrane protein
VRRAREGLHEGLSCLASYWGLMATLVVVGIMNLTWMAAITVVIAAEKSWRDRAPVSLVAGAVLVGLGLAVLAHPQFLTTLGPAS